MTFNRRLVWSLLGAIKECLGTTSGFSWSLDWHHAVWVAFLYPAPVLSLGLEPKHSMLEFQRTQELTLHKMMFFVDDENNKRFFTEEYVPSHHPLCENPGPF